MKGPFDPHAKPLGSMIVLSGLDGSGKSTQAEHLARRLSAAGVPAKPVWNRWEPTLSAPIIRLAKKRLGAAARVDEEGYEEFRDAKRRAMRSGLKRRLWQMLAWSEYAWQVRRRLRPLRRRKTAVICDRYVYDTLIDIAINFSVPARRIADLMDHPLLGLFPKPALVVFVDIDPELGAQRKSDGTSAAYLADRREYYREMARILNAPVVDGAEPVERVAEKIWSAAAHWRASYRNGLGGNRP